MRRLMILVFGASLISAPLTFGATIKKAAKKASPRQEEKAAAAKEKAKAAKEQPEAAQKAK